MIQLTEHQLANLLIDYHLEHLVQQYQKEEKKYHNLQHITYCINQLCKHYEKHDDMYHHASHNDTFFAQLIALIFHDVAYNVHQPQNHEQRSLEYFRETLQHYPNEQLVDRLTALKDDIESLILSTKHGEDDEKTIVSDIDMLILADSQENYDQYAAAVRQENAPHYDNYDELRLAFLQNIQARAENNDIYKHYPHAHQSVVENTQREIDHLLS